MTSGSKQQLIKSFVNLYRRSNTFIIASSNEKYFEYFFLIYLSFDFKQIYYPQYVFPISCAYSLRIQLFKKFYGEDMN